MPFHCCERWNGEHVRWLVGSFVQGIRKMTCAEGGEGGRDMDGSATCSVSLSGSITECLANIDSRQLRLLPLVEEAGKQGVTLDE